MRTEHWSPDDQNATVRDVQRCSRHANVQGEGLREQTGQRGRYVGASKIELEMHDTTIAEV